MPKHISKNLSITLFNDEVEAWQKVVAVILKRRLADPDKFDVKKPILGVIFRDLLQIAATHLADEIGPEIAQKLASPLPIPDFLAARQQRMQEKLDAKAKALVDKPAPKNVVKKAPPKPTQRTVWNRPQGSRSGVAR